MNLSLFTTFPQYFGLPIHYFLPVTIQDNGIGRR